MSSVAILLYKRDIKAFPFNFFSNTHVYTKIYKINLTLVCEF